MNQYFNKAVVVLCFAIFSNEMYAQADSIDVFIIKEMRGRKIPGLQLAIVKMAKLLRPETMALRNRQ